MGGKAAGTRLPGFGLTLGLTVSYVSVMVLLPLGAMLVSAAGIPWHEFAKILSSPRVLAAFKLSFGTAFLAALVDAVLGFLTAWVLVRYSFPGRRLLDGLVDLPFAIPTAVAGLALTAIYAPNGPLGHLLEKVGISVAFSPLGILVALVFVGFPFVVRSVQPALLDLDRDTQEAAATLGAGRWRIFASLTVPASIPALLTGFSLAFARGLGEYGSVVFISGNMPMKTEIVPLLIMTRLEQFDYHGATALAVVMLVLSFLLLGIINLLHEFSGRYTGHTASGGERIL